MMWYDFANNHKQMKLLLDTDIGNDIDGGVVGREAVSGPGA